MTIGVLISKYYEHNPDGHYFDRDTLKFFGERLSSMYVLKNTVTITTYGGDKHTCYVVSKLGKQFDDRLARTYAYFDTTTFEAIHKVVY